MLNDMVNGGELWLVMVTVMVTMMVVVMVWIDDERWSMKNDCFRPDKCYKCLALGCMNNPFPLESYSLSSTVAPVTPNQVDSIIVWFGVQGTAT